MGDGHHLENGRFVKLKIFAYDLQRRHISNTNFYIRKDTYDFSTLNPGKK